MIRIKRIYERSAPEDGFRVLVDRIWPRGLKKKAAGVDLWLKEIAPSPELRKWFAHDPAKWAEFRRRYNEELKDKRLEVDVLRVRASDGTVTLLFSAKDAKHNNAVVLKAYLESSVKNLGGG